MIFGAGAAALVVAPAPAGVAGDVDVLQTYASEPREPSELDHLADVEFGCDITVYGPEVTALVKRYLEQMTGEMQTLPHPAGEPGTLVDAIDLIIPHQANKRMVIELAEQAGIGRERMYFNIARVGNTSAGEHSPWRSRRRRAGANRAAAGDDRRPVAAAASHGVGGGRRGSLRRLTHGSAGGRFHSPTTPGDGRPDTGCHGGRGPHVASDPRRVADGPSAPAEGGVTGPAEAFDAAYEANLPRRRTTRRTPSTPHRKLVGTERGPHLQHVRQLLDSAGVTLSTCLRFTFSTQPSRRCR